MDHVLFQQCIVARVPPKQCVSENIFLRAIRKTFSFVQCARAGLIGSKKKKKQQKKKVALIRFPPPNWIPISFKCDEYWQSIGVRLIIFMRGLFYKHGDPRNRLKISMLSNRLEF